MALLRRWLCACNVLPPDRVLDFGIRLMCCTVLLIGMRNDMVCS